MLLIGGWIAIHRVPGFGPLVADSARALVGPKAVAWAEDFAYGVQDWINRRTRAGEAPEAYWEVPTNQPEDPPAKALDAGQAVDGEAAKEKAGLPPFKLASVGPVYESVVAKGDGVWVPVIDPRNPDAETCLLKTLVHPDRARSWATVAVVAADLRRVQLHPVAGRFEPESRTPEAKKYKRRAVIDPQHHGRLLAAFNGSYKSTHGHYGMKVDSVVLTKPRIKACTIAEYDDGRLTIRPWEAVRETEAQMLWYRQAPICFYDEGKRLPALSMPNIPFGASAVSGTTVIRRSAIGLSRDGQVLYVGIGDFTTARSIGDGMHHAGAHNVSQLDVNFSFPKFVTYDWSEPGSKQLKAIPLTKRFEYTEDQYIGTRSHRDFFYLTRRQQD